MNFKNIGILDDSIGGIEVLNSLEKKYNENFIYYADLGEYPYGMKNLSINRLSNNAAKRILKENLKVLIISNPAIALNIEKNCVLTINGIESAISSLKEESLILTTSAVKKNIYFNNLIKGKNHKVIDAQILINTIQDSDKNHYIIFKLIEEYIGNTNKDILLLDSNLSLLKEKFIEYNENLKVLTLNEFIIKDFEEKFITDLKTYSKNKTKVNYLVSDYRIAFYLSAEEFFNGRYSKVRKDRA